MSKVVIVGAGVNGVTAAIELKKRGHQVILIDPGPLPHPLAASTDISKAVRAAYGADNDYTELAERSIKLWRKWNEEFGIELYHEVGVMFVRRREMEPGDFEYESFKMLQKRGLKVERMNSAQVWRRFPAWNPELFRDGILEVEAGYAESGRSVAALIKRAKSLGVELLERHKFEALDDVNGRITTVILSEVEESRGESLKVTSRGPSTPLGMTRIAGDRVVMTVGAWTPYLLPFTKKFFRASGQPVFHLKPRQPELFTHERFPVFGADITATGYYGFPLNRDGIVKIANHGPGREMSPESSQRTVTSEDEANLRNFLSWAFPDLADAQIVYTRVCMYCETHDGNFWIAQDPERQGLVIAAGDCGHGFKFAPVLGEIIADAVEEKSNPILEKFRWRPEVRAGSGTDVARFHGENESTTRLSE
ncbi:MAG: sarcosine oxidase [Verrucomicrobia bacterium]|nr:MAG: sarcosine oxidase [Verrucomicrobiota bacterium]